MVLVPDNFVVAMGKGFCVTALVLGACVVGGLEISGRAAGMVVPARAGFIAPLLALDRRLFVEVAGGTEVAAEGLVSDSCSDSLEESALVLDDWLVCCGDDSIESVMTEEDPPWLLFEEEEASTFTGTF